jgi:zinc transport system substrate-binding protein
MKNKFIIGTIVLVIIIVISLILSTNKVDNIIPNNKVKVVTTLFPLYDFAREIGGDKVEVSLLLPPGVEAHAYEPKPSDIIKVNKADLFIYTGKYMEPWAEDIIKGITNKKINILDASVGLTLMKSEHIHDDDHDVHDDDEDEHEEDNDHHLHSEIDPHIWLGLDNTQIMVNSILNKLIEVDQENSDYYTDRATLYKSKLLALDNLYKNDLSMCKSKKIIYGGHYAFGYLAKRYGLTYRSAYGFSPDSEPTAKDLINLVKEIKEHNIDYIFYEELFNPKIAETLANETKTKMLLLNGAHNITKEDYQKGISFLSIMENNLINLKIGLSCNN